MWLLVAMLFMQADTEPASSISIDCPDGSKVSRPELCSPPIPSDEGYDYEDLEEIDEVCDAAIRRRFRSSPDAYASGMYTHYSDRPDTYRVTGYIHFPDSLETKESLSFTCIVRDNKVRRLKLGRAEDREL